MMEGEQKQEAAFENGLETTESQVRVGKSILISNQNQPEPMPRIKIEPEPKLFQTFKKYFPHYSLWFLHPSSILDSRWDLEREV